jgi:hypothetical protein
MSRSSSLLGLVGLILLIFGGLALYLTGELSIYVLAHLALGFVLLAYFLVARFQDLGQLLSARSTKYGANMVVYSVLFVACWSPSTGSERATTAASISARPASSASRRRRAACSMVSTAISSSRRSSKAATIRRSRPSSRASPTPRRR